MRNKIWVESYRPKTVDELILPEHTMNMLRKFRDTGDVPNMLFHSNTPGTGKTSAAKALARDLGYDVMVINGSDTAESGIDALRTNIRTFASSVSLDNTKKMIIIDEGDYLSNTVQPALRNFLESFSKNCIFVITCNYVNRIIEPLRSRLSMVEFTIPSTEKITILKQFHKRVMQILDTEGVTYEPKLIAQFIAKSFPDFRKTINELQRLSFDGTLDDSILSNTKIEELKRLFEVLKTKNFKETRKWVVENIDIGTNDIFRSIYDNMNDFVEPKSIPLLVTILADYQHKSVTVADQEINMMASFVEIMSEVNFLSL
jgi:DNA polymerase III delta prime subunit